MVRNIVQFISPPVFADDEEKNRNARLLNIIVLTSLVGSAAVPFLLPAVRRPYAFIAILILLGVWRAFRRGHVRGASVALILGIGLVLVGGTLTGGGVRATGLGAFTVLILFAGLLLGWRAAVAVTIFSILYGVALLWFESAGLIHGTYEPSGESYLIANSIYFIMTGIMLTLALQMIENARRRATMEIEKRKRARDEYQALFDNSLIGIYRSSVEGRMIEANRALTQFNGYESKAEFMAGVTDISREWYVDSNRRLTFQREIGEYGQVKNFESEVYRHKTRERVWISESAHVVRDSKGGILYYEGTVEDITSRKQSELDLRRRDSTLEVVTFSAEQFLKAPEWRDVIDEVLQRLGTTIEATHAYLFEDHQGPDGEALTSMRYEWTAPGYPSELESRRYQNSPVHQEGFEEQVEQLSRGDVRMGTSKTFNPIEKKLMDEAGIRAILEVPIFVDGREWGAIGFNDFAKEREWNASEVDALKIAANVLGTAIKRQRDETTLQNELIQRKALIEELRARNSESETLRGSLESIVSSLDFSQIIETILDQIRRVVPYDSASIWRIENKRQTFITGRNVPQAISAPGFGFDINPDNSAYPILEENLPYLLNLDVQAQLKDFQTPPHDYVQTWLAIPLKRRGQIVGLIAIDGMQKNQFDDHHANLAVTFANQVSIALENSRLFSELQAELMERKQVEASLRQRESILAVVAAAANLLLEATDWKLEIDSILENLGQTISASHAYICENHRQEDGVPVSSMRFEWTEPAYPSDLGDPKYENVPLSEPDFESWYRILQSGRPYIGDISRLNREDMDFLLARNMKALLDVPIFVDGNWWGTIGFDDMAVFRVWTRAEIDALHVAGNILGAAIQRQKADALLKEELTQRKQAEASLRQRESILEAVADAANQFLKVPDWRTEIHRILESLGRNIHVGHAYLFEKHMGANGVLLNSLRYEWAAPGQTSDMENPAYQNAPLHEFGFERYYETLDQGEPFVGGSSFFTESEKAQMESTGIKALLEMRIVVNGRQWGTIGFDEMTVEREWTPIEVDVIRVSANVLGAAIKRQMDEAALQNELTQRTLLIDELESKNAELERFTYTVSHDLKSPLFTIRGFLGYLEQDALSGDRERLRKDAQRIADATDKMQQLLNDLLELSRIGRVMNEPQELPFNELVRDVLELVHGLIQECGVTVQVQGGLPSIHGDRQRLSEVMQNLVENAVKFMGSQSHPRIEIGQVGEESGMPVFFVRDNGMGIPVEQYDRIFGLFNQLDPRLSGTGIGLALVKRIIEIHGGRIWVESEPGIGSTFFFSLPPSGQPIPFDQNSGQA